MISTNKKIKVAVVGDLMVDVYHYGKVNRISPEFPTVILKSTQTQCDKFPGGAANVAYQFIHLNADVTLFGFKDQELNNLNLDLSGCIDFGNIPQKHQFYSENYQLLRHDIESIPEESESLNKARNTVFNLFLRRCSSFDIVIFSNYAKGFFDQSTVSKFIKCCKDNGVITIADPKENIHWWKGCDIIKPNFEESCKMTNTNNYQEQIERLKEITHCKAIIITKSGNCVFGYGDNGYFEINPDGKQRGVNSVIGAGDCFLAYFSSLIARNERIEFASKLSFIAGSIYVQNKHNKPVYPYEVYKRMNNKIVSINDLKNLDKKIVFTNGCFDILGKHHLNLLNFAKSKGDILVVGLNSDASIKRLKGEKRPINCLEDRMELISNISCVDFVISFEEDTPLDLIKELKPNLIVKGSDYKKDQIAGVDVVGENNIVLFPILENYSTTKLIEKIKN